MSGDPDRSISDWLDPGTQVETRRSAESFLSIRSILSVTDCPIGECTMHQNHVLDASRRCRGSIQSRTRQHKS
jgi:hypothetical protein